MSPDRTSPIDLELVREFCALADEHDLLSLDVSYREFRLSVSRGTAPPAAPALAPPSPVMEPASEPVAPPRRSDLTAVKSPLAGVFYRAVRPGAAAFVEEGDDVQAGQTLCIIEAMKLMNEITAEKNGRVHRILVQNAEVVEAGQEIILLAPAGG